MGSWGEGLCQKSAGPSCSGWPGRRPREAPSQLCATPSPLARAEQPPEVAPRAAHEAFARASSSRAHARGGELRPSGHTTEALTSAQLTCAGAGRGMGRASLSRVSGAGGAWSWASSAEATPQCTWPYLARWCVQAELCLVRSPGVPGLSAGCPQQWWSFAVLPPPPLQPYSYLSARRQLPHQDQEQVGSF